MSMRVVANVADLPDAGAVGLEVDGVEIAIVRAEDDTFHAVSDICTHGEVNLSDGEVEDCTIECWKHGSQFDLRTGAPLQLPAVVPIAVYPLDIDESTGAISVDTSTTTNGR